MSFDPRRRINVRLPYRTFLTFLHDWRRHLEKGGFICLPRLDSCRVDGDDVRLVIPPTAELLHVTDEPYSRCLLLVFCDDSFPAVPDGARSPEAQLTECMVTALPAEEGADGCLRVTVPGVIA